MSFIKVTTEKIKEGDKDLNGVVLTSAFEQKFCNLEILVDLKLTYVSSVDIEDVNKFFYSISK